MRPTTCLVLFLLASTGGCSQQPPPGRMEIKKALIELQLAIQETPRSRSKAFVIDVDEYKRAVQNVNSVTKLYKGVLDPTDTEEIDRLILDE